MEESATNVAEKPVCVFESQADDEKLIFLLRAHIITNIPWIVITVLLAFVPAIFYLLGFAEILAESFAIPQKSFQGFILIWYLFVFAFAFQHFLSWYFNIYILTDRRIVDVDFFQLLYKKISSAQLDNVEDVTTTTGGVAQVLFHYGDVHIQTAGTVVNFEFIGVPKPGEVKKAIDQAITNYKKNT